MENFNLYLDKIIFTLISLGILAILRSLAIRIIQHFALKWERFHTRTTLIQKMVNYLFGFTSIVCLLIIWSIKYDSISLFLSSIFAVIGVAFFAQWSILSNVTSGIIMFFTFPYKIGDFIKIHEGSESICGYITDIRSFQVLIQNLDNEIITYPNSMMLQKGISILNEESIEKLKLELQKKKEESETEDPLIILSI